MLHKIDNNLSDKEIADNYNGYNVVDGLRKAVRKIEKEMGKKMIEGGDTAIYLISDDGYRSTITLDCYATNHKEIIKIIEKELAVSLRVMYGKIVFNGDMSRVKFQSKFEWEDDEGGTEENWYILKLINVEEL